MTVNEWHQRMTDANASAKDLHHILVTELVLIQFISQNKIRKETAKKIIHKIIFHSPIN